MNCLNAKQAVLRAFLNIHGSTIVEVEGLRERAGSIQSKLTASWERIERKLQHVKCLVNFLGNLP